MSVLLEEHLHEGGWCLFSGPFSNVNLNSAFNRERLQGRPLSLRIWAVCVCVCVWGYMCCFWSPCLHLFQCTGFIVYEHLFDKGLEGFQMNLVSVSFTASVRRLEIRRSRANRETTRWNCAFHLTSRLIYLWINRTFKLFTFKGDVSLMSSELTCLSVTKSYGGLKLLKRFTHLQIKTWH